MTEDQMSLLELHEIVLPQHEATASIEQRFHAFHDANPWVYNAMVALIRRYVANGAQRVSVKMLTEVIRYEYGSTRGDESWKLNNNFTSHYARLLLREHPEWDGLIETRLMRSAA